MWAHPLYWTVCSRCSEIDVVKATSALHDDKSIDNHYY